MSRAKKGDTVAIHYTGRFDDGTVFDSSRERDPLEFTLGERQVIPGLEDAVEGMEPGEERTTTIPSQEAYGVRREDLLVVVPRERLPEGVEPEVGERLEVLTDTGDALPVRVVRSDDDVVVIDANHPLAGEDLTFEIELLKIA